MLNLSNAGGKGNVKILTHLICLHYESGQTKFVIDTTNENVDSLDREIDKNNLLTVILATSCCKCKCKFIKNHHYELLLFIVTGH